MPYGILVPHRTRMARPVYGTPLTGGSSLRDRLAFAWVASDRGGTTLIDAVTGRIGAMGSSGYTWDRYRGALHFDTTFADFGTGIATQDFALNEPATFAIKLQRNGLVSGSWAERNDGNTVNAGWAWGNTAGGTGEFQIECSTTNAKISAGMFTDDELKTAVVVLDGGVGAGNVAQFWRDGVLIKDGWSTPGVGTRGSDAGQSFHIAKTTGAFGSLLPPNHTGEVFVEFLYIWRRMLSPAEIISLQSDPYAMFAQSSVGRLYFDTNAGVVSGSGSVTIGPDAIDGTGTVTNGAVGTGAIAFAVPAISGSGTATAPSTAGDASIVIGHPAISGTGRFTNPFVLDTQQAVETQEFFDAPVGRTSSQGVEDLEWFDAPIGRVTQMGIDDLELLVGPAGRLSQICVEILIPFDCNLTPPLTLGPACVADIDEGVATSAPACTQTIRTT